MTTPSRVASGTIVRIHTHHQESVVRQDLQLVIRTQMVLAVVVLVVLVLVGGVPLLLSTSRLLVLVLGVLVLLGLVLRMAMPKSPVAPGRGTLNPLRLLALPVTRAARNRTVDVLS